jgi:hypothetical protein
MDGERGMRQSMYMEEPSAAGEMKFSEAGGTTEASDPSDADGNPRREREAVEAEAPVPPTEMDIDNHTMAGDNQAEVPAAAGEAAEEAWLGPKGVWQVLSMEQQLACLPPVMQPTGPPRGQYSYTLRDPSSEAIIEVLLRERACFARRTATGATPAGPRAYAWRAYGSPEAAYEHALRITGWRP